MGRSNDTDAAALGAEGEELAFLAPGNKVVSTKPADYGQPRLWEMDSGTSFATPLAAGVAALLISARPTLTAAEVRQIMEDACDRLPGMESGAERDDKHGHGRINALKALSYAVDLD